MQSTLPQPGTAVWIRGQRWRLTSVRSNNDVARLEVTGEVGRQAFLYPFDRCEELRDDLRPIRARPQRARARLAWVAGRTFGCRTLGAAVDGRFEILPHQLAPALAAIEGARRILIADDVGLGKTIQAGLIAAEILRREASARVLVVAPAALVPQWAAELRSRFDLACVAVDREGFDRRAQERAFGDNPWNGAGIFLSSLDFLKQPHVLAGLPARAWDLVVIDEAHTACGHSDRHLATHFVSARSRCVVLLTATPHSGDEARFTRLLNIGRLAGDQPTVFRRRRADVGLTTVRRTAWHHVSLSQPELRVFKALNDFERVVIKAAQRDRRDEAGLLLAVFRKRALSTMGALAMSIDRRLAWLSSAGVEPADGWLQGRLDLGDQEPEDVASEDDLLGLRARTGLEGETERSWLRRLAHLAASARGTESKARRVVRLIARTRESVIVFTEFRDSLNVLVGRLQLLRPLAVLHGGLTAAERAEALERLRTGDATVLVATDVAGQGLNLQHRCRWVISLELPWNPTRLEQRIGRVDRIGQAKPVHFTLLVARHRSEANAIARLNARVQTATQAAVPLAARTWVRLSSRAARQLELRRRLVRQWRGPDLSGRPIRSHRSPIASAVFSVPLLDRAGSVVEMHVVAVPIAGAVNRDVLAEAGRAALARLRPRLHRVRRWRAGAVSRRMPVERAIADTMRSAIAVEAQPGLFDATALRAFEADRGITGDIDQQFETAAGRLHLAADVEPGRPVLEILWLRDR